MSAQATEKEQGGGLLNQPLVIHGKRKRKGIETFSINNEVKRPVQEYTGGSGIKLGDIDEIQKFIKRHSSDELKPLHRICLDRPGSRLEVKKNLREFTGFTFEKDSEQYFRKKASLDKLSKIELEGFLEALNLPIKGSKEAQVLRILDFLLSPTNSRSVKRSSSTVSKSGSAGIKKAKVLSTEEIATQTESSTIERTEVPSSEDIHVVTQIVSDGIERRTEVLPNDDAVTKNSKPSGARRRKAKTLSSQETVTTSRLSGRTTGRRRKTRVLSSVEIVPEWTSRGARRRKTKAISSKEIVDDEGEKSDGAQDGETEVAEPCTEPSDCEIMETVKEILKGADLHQATTKSVCLQVYSRYPQVDLSKRKNYVVACIEIVTAEL